MWLLKTRSYSIQVGTKSRGLCPYQQRGHGEGGHVKMEAEPAGTQPQAKEGPGQTLPRRLRGPTPDCRHRGLGRLA